MENTMAAVGVLSSQIGAATLSHWIIVGAQKWTKLTWISEHTKTVNWVARLLTSGVSTVGITWVWGGVSGGGHTLTIAIPSMTVVVLALWHWFIQIGIQHGWGNLLEGVNPQNIAKIVAQVMAQQPPASEPAKP
jgi:hypothetical protein